MPTCFVCAHGFHRSETNITVCGRCKERFADGERAALVRPGFKAIEVNAVFGSRFTMTMEQDATGWRIVFQGGASAHSIAAEPSITSNERLTAHWLGYLDNNGVTLAVGQRVSFVSGRWDYTGVVTKITRSRVTVEFKYRSGRKAAPRTMPIRDVRWNRLVKVGV